MELRLRIEGERATLEFVEGDDSGHEVVAMRLSTTREEMREWLQKMADFV